MTDLAIYIGTKIRLRATFRKEVDPNTPPTINSPVADPTEIFMTIRLPSGAETIYQYGVGNALQKESTGKYYIEYTPIVPYRHKAIWKGTGAVQQVHVLEFYVEPV